MHIRSHIPYYILIVFFLFFFRFFFSISHRNIDGPHLVITPKTALQNWTDELQRWCPSLDVVCMIGNADARNATFRKLKHTKKYVLITSFEMCTIEAYRLSSISWCYIITDEGHRLKNEKTRLATVLRTITCKHRLLLTGSPLNNNMRELWALLNYLMPQIFDCSITFDAIFDMNDWNEDKKTFKRLLNIINALLLRREKADVERSLLPKIMTTVYADITPMQMELYQQIIRKEIHVINGTGQVKKQKLQNIVMNLRKCTNHPYLFDGIEPEPFVEGDHLINNCGKMVVLDNLLTKLKANGSRVLVFSQMTSMLDILEDYCEWRGFDYCRLDGKTSHQQRGQYTAEYNAPKSKKFIFLLSTRAGGLSINLTSADAVVIYDSDWNPQMDLQAMDRAHRIGQKKQVKVFRLITKNSIDERIAQLAEEKLRLGKLIDIKSSRKAALSLEQMLDMIRQNADYVLDEIENIRSSSRSNEPESITKQRKFSASNPLINSTMECVKRR